MGQVTSCGRGESISRKSRGDDLVNCHERMNDDPPVVWSVNGCGDEEGKDKSLHSPSIHLTHKSFVYPEVSFPFPSQSKGDDQAKGHQKGFRVLWAFLTPIWVEERLYIALIPQWKGGVGGELC